MRAFIFDTETTGLFKFFNRNHTTREQLKGYPFCIELFGHTVEDDGNVLGEIEFFAEPDVTVTEEITRITGIKPEDVAGQPKFGTNVPRILDMLKDADAIVAHNLKYDMQILETELKRAGAWGEAEPIIKSMRRVCTVEQSMHYKGHRLNLTALHEHLFGEGFEGAHRARTDVNALTRCYLEMVKRGDI